MSKVSPPLESNDHPVDQVVKQMQERQPVHCPKCNERISIGLVAKAAAESRMSFSLTPTKGEKMGLGTVAGSMAALDKLLVSVGKQLGTKTTVLIERFETGEEGQLTVHMLIARVA